MATEDLDSIFDGKVSEPVEANPVEPQAQPLEPVTEPEVETGVTPEEPAPPAELDPVGKDQGPLVPRRALEDERKKRQEFERRFTELEQRLQQTMQPPPQQPEPQQAPPNPWEDPEGAMAYQRNEFARQMYETRVALSTEIVRSQNKDFDEVVAEFVAAAQRDAGLHRAVLNHPNPAAFAYQEGRKIRFLKEVGSDPDAYKARLREELMAEMGQGQGQPVQAQPAIAPPKSLAGTTSAQPRNSRGQFAPGSASLDDILGG